MIFVSTGSRKFQFDRLIKKLDEIAPELDEPIFAQIAETAYLPKHFEYKRYLSPEEFSRYQEEASLVITHAGTGALITALKKGKQVISIPRLAKYDEHSDDHQLQVSGALRDEGYLREVIDMDDLLDTIRACKRNPIQKKYDKPSNIAPLIERYIDSWFA